MFEMICRFFKLFVYIVNTCLTLQLFSFEILPQSPKTEGLGYYDWNIAEDGESLLVKQFLKPQSLVFDVGGNHGEWSLCALKAQPTIQIKVFEPVPLIFEGLVKTLRAYPNVQVFNYALSDQKGVTKFHYYTEADGLSGFYYREVLRGDQPDPQIISVNQETLDDFCQANSISTIDFIKIDTEGAEWKIIKSAQNLLKNHRIRAIQFEYGGCYIDAKTTLEQVLRLLKKHRYVIFRIIPTGLIHISKWEPSLENFHLSNYFAICEEDLPGYSLVEF